MDLTLELCSDLQCLAVKLVQDFPCDVQPFDLMQLVFTETWDLVLESIELPDLASILGRLL